MSLVSCLVSQIYCYCLLSPVSCLFLCLLFHVLLLLSHVSCLKSLVLCRLSHITFSRLMSPVSCLIYPVSLLSQVPSTVPNYATVNSFKQKFRFLVVKIKSTVMVQKVAFNLDFRQNLIKKWCELAPFFSLFVPIFLALG